MTVNFTAGNDRFKAVAYLKENKRDFISYDLFVYEKGWVKMSTICGSLKSKCEQQIKQKIQENFGNS